MDGSRRSREFIRDEDRVGALKDLKGIRHVGRARNTGHEALDFRIALEPVLAVFFLLRRRPRMIRDLIAVDDALARGHRADRPERTHRRCGNVGWCGAGKSRNARTWRRWNQRQRRSRRMGLDVVVRGVEGLPYAAEIGLAVGSA